MFFSRVMRYACYIGRMENNSFMDRTGELCRRGDDENQESNAPTLESRQRENRFQRRKDGESQAASDARHV